MLKKLIRLNINDIWLCLGAVAVFFLAAQGITAAVLLFVENVHSVPLVSGVALPIVAGIMTLVVSISHTSVSFVQALRFGQTRRRALGMMLSMALFESACATALAAALAWVERAFFPALWLSLSGLGKMVWGGIPPVPEPSIWQGSDQEWTALLDEISSTLYLEDFALDWWWFLVIPVIGLALGFIVGAFLQRFGSRGGRILWGAWMVICFAPQLLGDRFLLLTEWSQWITAAGSLFAAAAGVWSVWSLLHAVVKN